MMRTANIIRMLIWKTLMDEWLMAGLEIRGTDEDEIPVER